MQENDDLIWKALADPTRRQLLDLLRDHSQTTTELCTHFAPVLSRFAVMKHLHVLQQADLILVRQHGRERWHSLNAIPLRRIYERWVSQYASDWAASLLHLKHTVELKQPTHREEPIMETLHIEQEIVINAKPEHVFEALTTTIDAWWAMGYESPDSTFHLEPVAGGRFYEDFGAERGSALYATVTYLEPARKLRMTGPMAMRGPVLATIGFDLEAVAQGTLLKLSHHAIGTIDPADHATYTNGWQKLLGEHLKRFVERHQGYRSLLAKGGNE